MAQTEIIVEGYELEPQAYYWRGKRQYDHAIDQTYPPAFFYSALEFRCCIEQVLRVYLEMIGLTEWNKKFLKMYRAKDLKNTILEMEPEYYEKLKFVDILIRSVGQKGVYMLDLDRLNTLYGQIGNYLHAQIQPTKTVENPKWWGMLYELLKETEEYLKNILSHDMAGITPNEKGWSLYDRWKSGDITDSEVMQEFRDGLMD